jgi:hypothetical protein
MVREQQDAMELHVMPKSVYYHPMWRSAEYTHRDLRNYRKRQEILRLHPGTNFDLKAMTDDNISDFWYVGRPMEAAARKVYHETRALAANYFDKHASFVKNYSDPHSPPPLVLLIADKIRRQEVIELKGRAQLSVQKKYHIFMTDAFREPEDRLAEDILTETPAEFLDRKADVFLCIGNAWMSIVE